MSIIIEKIKEIDCSHYYRVESCSGGINFFICIDSSKDILYFYKTVAFVSPIAIIDFNKTDKFIEIPGIIKNDSNLVIMQSYKALKTNNFPKSLSVIFS